MFNSKSKAINLSIVFPINKGISEDGLVIKGFNALVAGAAAVKVTEQTLTSLP